jgi:hypothetical protein
MHSPLPSIPATEQPLEPELSPIEAAAIMATTTAASLNHDLEPYQSASGSRAGMLISRCYLCSALAYVLPSSALGGSALALPCNADNPSSKYLARLASELSSASTTATRTALEATATRIASSHSTLALEALAAARLYPCSKCGGSYTLVGRSCSRCAIGSAAATEPLLPKSKRYINRTTLNPLQPPLPDDSYLLPAVYRVLNSGSNSLLAKSRATYTRYRLATVTVADPSKPYIALCGSINLWRLVYMLEDTTASSATVAAAIVVYPCHIDTCRSSL